MPSKKSDVNITRIEFDDKLKQCVANMPTHLIDDLADISYCKLHIGQERIRKYFIEHENELTMKGHLAEYHNSSFGDFFALLCATIADLSQCKSWKDVYEQFSEARDDAIKENLQFCEYGEGDVADMEDLNCMCSHHCHPENMAIITNPHTGLNAFVACDCIDKLHIINSYQFKKLAKLNKSYKKMIERREKVNLQKKEMKEKIEKYRKCVQCGQLTILKNDPTWKKKCVKCYLGVGTGVCLLLKK